MTLLPSEVELHQVQLLDGYTVNAVDRTVEYLLRLDPQRFLHGFYRHSGLTPTTAHGYGGWESGSGPRFSGHFFGHFISALAQASASMTAESASRLLQLLESSVHGLRDCQAAYAAQHPMDAGYVSAFSIDALPSGADGLIVPFYNLHKILAGLIDAHRYAPPTLAATALEVASQFGTWLAGWAARQADPRVILDTDYGGMNDALYDLYRLTGNLEHRVAAEFFDEIALFETLAAGVDVLDGLHANTTIPKVIGALKRYSVLTGDMHLLAGLSPAGRDLLPLYRSAAENFWVMITGNHSYANGGNSQAEHFHRPGSLCERATSGSGTDYAENSTCEGCNAYNMLKLTLGLFELTHDVRYADYYESTLINSILASQHPITGMVTYFQPMAPGYAKVFGHEFDEFWCDQGTALESFTKLAGSTYFATTDGVTITQFRSSVLTLPSRNLRIRQLATVPDSDVVTLTVDAIEGTRVPEPTVLRLRVPRWTSLPTLSVNGHSVETGDAEWIAVPVRAGDTLEYRLPAAVELVDDTENPHWVAFRYGPSLLAAELSRSNVGSTYPAGVMVQMSTASGLDSDLRVEDPTAWKASANLVRIPDGPNADGQTTMRFELRNVDERWSDTILEPYYSLYGGRYAVYFMLRADGASDQP